MGHVLGARLVGDVNDVLGDQRAGEGGQQRVDLLVLGVCLDGVRQVLLGVLGTHVHGVGVDGAHVQGLLLDPGEVLLVLAHVAADGDDVKALLDLEPLDDDGRVKTAGVREDYLILLSHFRFPFIRPNNANEQVNYSNAKPPTISDVARESS